MSLAPVNNSLARVLQVKFSLYVSKISLHVSKISLQVSKVSLQVSKIRLHVSKVRDDTCVFVSSFQVITSKRDYVSNSIEISFPLRVETMPGLLFL